MAVELVRCRACDCARDPQSPAACWNCGCRDAAPYRAEVAGVTGDPRTLNACSRVGVPSSHEPTRGDAQHA